MENVYQEIQRRMYGRTTQYPHDEEKETKLIDEMTAYKRAAKDLYVRSLIHPEVHSGKIPSRIPIDSACASIKSNFTITPNKDGMFALIIDPFYGVGHLYQGDDLTGKNGTLPAVTNINFPQSQELIDQWRLVSCSLIARYYGNFSEMSGLFVCATTSNLSTKSDLPFVNFDNVENLGNKQVLKCLDGLKMIYSPMDESATDFHPNSVYSDGTHPCRYQYLFIVIGYNFPAGQNTIRVDLFRNIEYTTVPQYREYIEQTTDLPNDFAVPVIENPITPAPQVTPRVQRTPWYVQINEAAKGLLTGLVRTAVSSINPFVANSNPFGFLNFTKS